LNALAILNSNENDCYIHGTRRIEQLLSLVSEWKDKVILVSVSHHGIMDHVPVGACTFLPRFKKMVLKIRAITIVKKILVAVYDGFLQYDLCCASTSKQYIV
jgi:hypothetical protein